MNVPDDDPSPKEVNSEIWNCVRICRMDTVNTSWIHFIYQQSHEYDETQAGCSAIYYTSQPHLIEIQ